MDYVKRLRLCIRWFQELELDYAFEQEKLKNAMELNEKHCTNLGVFQIYVNSWRFFLWTFGIKKDLYCMHFVRRGYFEREGRGAEYGYRGTEEELFLCSGATCQRTNWEIGKKLPMPVKSNSRLIHFLRFSKLVLVPRLGRKWFAWKRERSKTCCWKVASCSHRRASKNARRASNS